MKVLSLIIPSYNCENFLDKCLASFVDDKIIDKLDVIVVNDGSVDKTADIATKYCNLYPNSFRLISQKNKGHGGALNTGCAAATGKYLKVIDADDWVITENLLEFINCLESADSDVVLTHHYTQNITTGETKKWMSYPESFGRKYTLEEIADNWDKFDRAFTFHGICYKTDFYQKAGYLLSEHVFYEDHEFSTFPACLARTVLPLDLFIYNYRIGDVNQSVSDENSVKRLTHTETVLKRFVCENKAQYDKLCSKNFVAYKAKILLVSYLTTALLVDKNRKAGKANAKRMMEYFKSEFLAVYNMCRRKYRTLKIMHFFRIKKSTLQKFLNSKLYYRFKGTKDFN